MRDLRAALVLFPVLLFLCPAAPLKADEPLIDQLEHRLAALTSEEYHGMPGRDRRPPLSLLRLKQARLAEKWSLPEAEKYARQGLESLDLATQNQLPPLESGELNELAYIATNDGSAQPYYLYLPPQFTPDRAWPLIVFLHGYVPDINVLFPWILGAEDLKIAGELGALVLIPYGRRNTDFQGVGEKDVLDALTEVLSRLGQAVDQDRLYLTGVSMGGRGAWHIAAHNPGLFAALAPIAGHTDMPRWWGWDRSTMPVWKRWLNERDNPLDLAENLRNLPIFVQHGAQDTLIPADQSRRMVTRLRELGLPVEYEEYPDAGHYIYWDPETYRLAWTWLLRHRRNLSPRRVTYKAYTLANNPAATAFWLTLGPIQHWGEPAYVDANRLSNTEVRAQARNWVSLAAHLPRTPAARLVVNGQPYTRYLTAVRKILALLCPDAPSESRDLAGPVADAFLAPFVLVYGPAGSEEQTAELRAQAERFADDWEAFADGRPRIVADRDFPGDRRDLTPILFGTPQTNLVVSALAWDLPVRIGNHRYGVGDRVFSGPTLGLALRHKGRVIFAGEYWGSHLSVNHKWDAIPDYIVYDTSRQEYDGTDQHLCAGLFDENWQINPALQTLYEP